LIVALNLNAGREFLRAKANLALQDVLVGRLQVDRIGHVNLDGLRGIDAHLLDARGRRVASLVGLSVRSNWPEIVKRLILSQPLVINLAPLRVDHIEIVMLDGTDGTPSLLNALSPRQPASDAGTPSTTTFAIQGLHVAHVWAHGTLSAMPVIDLELRELDADFATGPAGLSARLKRVSLVARAIQPGIGASGTMLGEVKVPPSGNEFMQASGEFSGEVAAASTLLRAKLQARKLLARAQVRDVPDALLRRFFPDALVPRPVSLDAEVMGELPQLQFTLTSTAGKTHLFLHGNALAAAETQAHADLKLQNFDLSNWVRNSSTTDFATEFHVDFAITPEGQWLGQYRVDLPKGRFGTSETPALSSDGTINRSVAGLLEVDGKLAIAEPGAPVRAVYKFAVPPNSATVLKVNLSSELSNPARVAKLAEVNARGTLNAVAELDFSNKRLKSDAVMQLSSVVHPTARLKDVRVRATAEGALTSPGFKVFIDAAEVESNRRVLRHVVVDATGTPQAMQVAASAYADKTLMFRLRSHVSTGQGIAIERPSLTIADPAGPIQVTAERIHFASGHIGVEGVEVSGLGELKASARTEGGMVHGELHAREFDLARVAHLLNVQGIQAGWLNLDATMAGSVRDPTARLNGQVRGIAVRGMHDGSIGVDLEFSRHRVNANIAGMWGRSKLRLNAVDVDVPEAAPSPRLIDTMQGEVTLDGDVDLAELEPTLRSFGLPIEELSGRLILFATARRTRGEDGATPVIQAHVKTERLRLVEERKPSASLKRSSEAVAARPRVIQGMDADVQVDLDPSRRQANLQGQLVDRLGPLLTVEGDARLPSLADGSWRMDVQRLPMRVALRLPNRVLQELPSVIRPAAMRGSVAAVVEAEGTVGQPRLKAQVIVKRLQSREGKYFVDARLEANSERERGEIKVDARSTRGGTASLLTEWEGDIAERFGLFGSTDVPFELRSHLSMNRFPLAVVPSLSDREIRGPLTGTVELTGLGRDAKLRVQLDGSGVTLNRIRLPRLKVSASADDREFLGSIDAGQGTGSARAEVRADSRWGKRWLPELASAVAVRLDAKRFQLAVLAPFVAKYMSTIEGLLDANFTGRLDPVAPLVEGHAEISDGVVQIPQLGQRFSDIRARIVAKNSEIVVDSIEAHGISGRLTASARAQLEGAKLRAVEGRVDIAEKEKLPVTLEGVVLGDAWGHAEVNYRQQGDQSEIKVDVPRFRLKMPETAQNTVQDLEPAEAIRIGAHRADGKFVPMPLQPLRNNEKDDEPPSTTRIFVQLGDSVWIDRGRELSVQIAGRLAVESGEEQSVTGQIELRTGKLDVSGKEFHIERGLVTFDQGEPSNPTITATARWDSPSGYVVYADYSGTVKDGKLKLHAEPNLSQDEILSLLLFGSPEGSMASSGGSGTTGALGSSSGGPGSTPGATGSGSNGSGSAGAAVSIAGGTATKGLNRAISDVTNLDVSTRIDTSTGSSRPELVVQLTPRLTTRVTRAIGEPTPGQSPDRTFITLELRLKRSWSASAMIGDHGASTFDLIWRRRY
jgi:translocation and assembly module TamB